MPFQAPSEADQSANPTAAVVGITGATCLLGGLLLAAFMWAAVHILRQRRHYETALGRAWLAARTDALTGLPNRVVVQEDLDAGRVALMALLDLDDFKQVNDSHGHDVGDDLLAVIARRLEQVARTSGAHPARLSGDEFLLLWEAAPDDPAADSVDHLRHLLTPVAAPVDLAETRVTVGISVGLALAGEHLHGTGLLRAADAAMYQAKPSPTPVTGPGQAPGHVPGQVRVHLWDDDHPPARADRRTRRDTPTAQTTPMSDVLSVVKEGTR